MYSDVLTVELAAELIRSDLAAARRPGDSLRVIRQFIADARRKPDASLVDAGQPPQSTGSKEWDAMLAAAVDMVLTEHRRPLPEWLRAPEQLDRWWFFNGIDALNPRSFVQSPPWFAMRGVFIQRSALENA